MNRLIISSIALGLLSLFSCARMTPEIVEFDPSYKPKEPTKLDRNKVDTPPLDLLDKYVLFKDNDPKILATISQDNAAGLVAQPIPDANVVVRLSSKLDKDLTVKVVEMSETNQPATFKKVMQGENKLLAQEMYTLSAREVTFAAGEVEQRLSIAFDKEKIKHLDKQYTYVVPLVVELPDVPHLKDYNYFLVSITIQESEIIPDRENVTFVFNGDNGLKQIPNTDIKASCTYRNDMASRLVDGNKSEHYWMPSDKGDNITLTFPTKKVKCIKIYTKEQKNVKSVAVAVSNTGGDRYVAQGTVTHPMPTDLFKGSPMYIVFTTPFEINAISLSHLVTSYSNTNDLFINISEIELYY